MPRMIVPAIIPESVAHLSATIAQLPFTPEVQIDLVDGVFAEPASWPYQPVGNVHDVTDIIADHRIEVDLMVENGRDAAEDWIDIGVRRFVFHIEAVDDADALITDLHDRDCAVGLAISNDTPLGTLMPYIEKCDFVQLMGIKTIGAQSQPFDDRVLFRTQQLRSEYPDLTISIDGSVNTETLPQLRDAGADRFVAGSAILGAKDPHAAYTTLAELL